MTTILKTTHEVTKNGLYLIKRYYSDGIVKIYAYIGNRIKFLEQLSYNPNEIK